MEPLQGKQEIGTNPMSSLILSPKFIMLDSSALIGLASDWSGENGSAGKQRADAFLNRLNLECWTLFLTFHHVVELLGTNDPENAQKRLQLICQLSFVAWLRPASKESAGTPGFALDIVTYEFDAVINHGASTLSDVIEHVRPKLIDYGKGTDIAPKLIRNRNELTQMSASIQDHGVEVASFLRAGDSQIQAMTLREFYRSPVRNREEVRAGLKAEANRLNRQLQAHGDERLTRPAAAARKFISSTAATLESFPDGTLEELTQQICTAYDVPHEFATPDITIGELGDLCTFAAQLRKVAPRIGLSENTPLKKEYPSLCPTWIFWKAIRECQTRANRAEGGDLNDANLAAMVLYIDLVHVDKRTHEYLSQVQRRHPELAGLMKQYSKAPYDRVLEQ